MLLPELFEDMTIDTYHAFGDFTKNGGAAVLSKTMLAEMDCPAKFEHIYINGNPRPAKSAFHIGAALHCCALEPDLFHDRFYVLPAGIRADPRSREYKSCLLEAKKRKIIPKFGSENVPGYDDVQGMAAAIVRSKKARLLLDRAGKVESSIFWTDPDSGLRLRCRPDFMSSDKAPLIVDVKKTKSVQPDKFFRDAFDYHYDMSAGMTADGIFALTGKWPDNYVFLAIEDKPPYVIEAFDSFRPWDPTDPAALTYQQAGNYRLRQALRRFEECRKANIWPGYSDKILPMGVPQYALKKLEN